MSELKPQKGELGMNPQVNECLKCNEVVKVCGVPVCGLEQTPCERIFSCPVERYKEWQRKHSAAALSHTTVCKKSSAEETKRSMNGRANDE